jgi:predicted MFS family arabinose efflux permease
VLGDLFGWRNVFFILGALFAFATLGLIYELITNPRTRPAVRPDERSRGFIADYKVVLSSPWARIVILAVFIESAFAWGAFAYVGADLNQRFGLSLTAVGLIVGCFAIGGLVYAATVGHLMNRFGQRGLAIGGATICGVAYLVLASGLAWWLAPVAVGCYGLGFYALHNTLQTCGTQMTPQARATGFALFSSAIYVGQTTGVGVSAIVFDRAGAVPLFVIAGLVLPALALWFARELNRRG